MSAPTLGAFAGVLVATSYFAWKLLAPSPCTGGLFVELHPPLTGKGPYQFELSLEDGAERCAFEVGLPVDPKLDKSRCPLPLELRTRVENGVTSLVGLTLGAAPRQVSFRVQSDGQKLYDTRLAPAYTPYPTSRKDERRFCGDRALLEPACVPGSPFCSPYAASCDGPEDCDDGRVCCLSPEQAREHGVQAASACRTRRACLDSFARVACHGDGDCPADMVCNDASAKRDFRAPLLACGARAPLGKSDQPR